MILGETFCKLDLPADLKKRGVHDVFHSSLLQIHIPNNDQLFPGRSYEQVVEIDSEEWQVDKILAHKGFKSDAMFLLLWKSGDKTWLPYLKVQHLQPLREYFETLSINDIAQLPPVVSGEDPIEGTEGLLASSVDFLEYKYPLDKDLAFPLSLNLIGFPAMSTVPDTPFFAPRDLPGIVLKWKEQFFEVTHKGQPPVQIPVDKMIFVIQTLAALCWGWKIPITPQYVEITCAINYFLPFETIAWFSFVHDGKTHNTTQKWSLAMTASSPLFSKFSFERLPPRSLTGHDNHRNNRRSGGSSALFDHLRHSQADRDIMVLGLMSYVCKNESQACQKHCTPKSVWGAEAYQKSIHGDGSTAAGLSDRINAWRITTPGKNNDAMDSSGPSAGPSTA
ncbi:hypothetical protein FB446DRAFT_794872 [Lentinula raphanica]|nr:hypothetical protein FB446DRAFT_794872 [Lentinula raphanica]